MQERFMVYATVAELCVAAAPAAAELCAIDAVPAATLLIPYFEVDLTRAPNKVEKTQFSVNNASEGSVWGARYFTGRDKTRLIVWRDSGVAQQPFSCDSLESDTFFPLGSNQIVFFDHQEDATELEDHFPFPAETQSVLVRSSALPTPEGYDSGWVYLNLNLGGVPTQSFVFVQQDFNNRRKSRAQAELLVHVNQGTELTNTGQE